MTKILLTRAGYEEILKELRTLSGEERAGLVQEIVEATSEWGDAGNPDFQRILAQKRRVERRIQYLEQILARAEVQVGSNLPADKVRFNCRVTIRHLANGKVQQFRLVGPVEADAAHGRLSMAAPLGQALLGRSVGERVDLDTPAGQRSYQILDISGDET